MYSREGGSITPGLWNMVCDSEAMVTVYRAHHNSPSSFSVCMLWVWSTCRIKMDVWSSVCCNWSVVRHGIRLGGIHARAKEKKL